MTRAPRLAKKDARLQAAALLSIIIMLALSVLFRRVDHDESQYVAAIALMRSGFPYRDFAYLQTPLQPLLLSPLSLLPPGWIFIAGRAVSGLCGLFTVLALWRALEQRVSFRARMVSVASLVCTSAFLFGSSLARNDALAMAFLAASLLPLLRGIEANTCFRFALAGVLMGLAISTKINAALPTAGAGIFLLIRWRKHGAGTLACFGIGLIAGLIPTLASAAIAPRAFQFQVITYNLQAPVQWWSSIGEADELNPLVRALKIVRMATLGPVVVALVAAGLDRRAEDKRRVLDLMITGGVVASFLPVPTLTQYLVPLLPPLFARFGFALEDAGPKRQLVIEVLAALTALAGLTSGLIASSPKLDVVRSAQLGSDVAALSRGKPVVSLSPEYVAGQGVNLDPRFAAGPFLYRTRGNLAVTAETYGRAVSVDNLDHALAERTPGVILVGKERQPFPPFPSGLDQPLVDWSLRNGYEARPLAHGFTAFVAPYLALKNQASK